MNVHIQLDSPIVCSRYEGIADMWRTIHIVQMGVCYVSWRREVVHIAVITESYFRAAVCKCKAFSGTPLLQLGFDAECVDVFDAEGYVRMTIAVVVQLDVVSKMNITLSGVWVEPRPRR